MEESLDQRRSSTILQEKFRILTRRFNFCNLWPKHATENYVSETFRSENGQAVDMTFEHQDRDVVENVHQTISGDKLTSQMSNNKGKKAVFYFKRN